LEREGEKLDKMVKKALKIFPQYSLQKKSSSKLDEKIANLESQANMLRNSVNDSIKK
jgi:hypothetical protein